MTTAASIMTKGWVLSTEQLGTTAEADFWFLLQSSLLQIAGMVPIFFSFLQDSNIAFQSRLWSWVFLAAGIALQIIAPILYSLAPKKWSAVLVFLGNVMQVFLILEAMVLVRRKSPRRTE